MLFAFGCIMFLANAAFSGYQLGLFMSPDGSALNLSLSALNGFVAVTLAGTIKNYYAD